MKGKLSFIHYNNNMLSVGGDMISTANCCYNGNSMEDGSFFSNVNGNVNGNNNGMRSMYLFPGGYCNLNDPTVTGTGDPGTDSISYHYYNKDHLGNNREVISENGQVEQIVHYYPFGTPFTDGSSTNIGLQPYLYGNKELDMMHGLNTYDFGARNYNPLLGQFTTMDRFCTKYFSVSPYAYCMGNPMSNIDVNGDSLINGELEKLKEYEKLYNTLLSHDITKLNGVQLRNLLINLQRVSNMIKQSKQDYYEVQSYIDDLKGNDKEIYNIANNFRYNNNSIDREVNVIVKIGDTNEDFGSSYTMALSEEELIKGNHFTTYIVRNSKSKDVLAHEMGHVYDNISNPKAYYNESVKNKNKPIGLRHNCQERNQYFNNILGNHSLRFQNHYNTGKW